MVTKIISGGQTGVDRAALDAALELGMPCGGWCPRGRRAADGVIPTRYPLLETPTDAYPERTEWNVRDSDATLILTRGKPDGGTALTQVLARRLGKPSQVLDFDRPVFIEMLRHWLNEEKIAVLNIAGPRDPAMYPLAKAFLLSLLTPNEPRTK